MRNAGLEEAQAGIKTAERNINNLGYAEDTILMAESEEELKSRKRNKGTFSALLYVCIFSFHKRHKACGNSQEATIILT